MPTINRPLVTLAVALALLGFAGAAQSALSNQLADHGSPYLAMHGADPVHWQEWGEKALSQARQENKLLFVSSGYFACHWCHVMQQESFRNKEIAALLNRHFIPVKVDRELNPALDAHLIDFVERTRGYAGWPLNAFITPQGYPLIGTLYLPAKDFHTLLSRLAEQWLAADAELKQLAEQTSAELGSARMSNEATLPPGLGDALSATLVSSALAQGDEFHGGFGSENKFPSVPQLEALLETYTRSRDPRLEQFLRLTLSQMASQGLRDQLGGGFFRYTVDPDWQLPHFEKMLYDNALLARLYLDAAGLLQAPQYAHIGRQTLDFMLEELSTDEGALRASLSAVDDRNVEGGYYLWQRDEFEAALSPAEYSMAQLFWGLDKPPQLEHGHHLVQATSIEAVAQRLQLPVSRVQDLLASAQTKLLEQRQLRKLPRDDKIVAAWNGLALSALTRGAQLEQGERYRQAAQRLSRYLGQVLWNGKSLARARDGSNALGEAALEDYAYVAAGLLDWAMLSNSAPALSTAKQLVESAWQRFYSETGWRLSDTSLLRYGSGRAALADDALPSASGILIQTTLELAALTDNDKLRHRALVAVHNSANLASEEPFWYATHVRALLTAQTLGASGSSPR
ncbi:MAG: hypothetical protein AMJ69_05880 [Gammaproteobacteria bacterium SG8_47]|nr:MAG: hypothetical protein AMJ69_05880 [Gammaproteobacteria bacterium SG8_47]